MTNHAKKIQKSHQPITDTVPLRVVLQAVNQTGFSEEFKLLEEVGIDKEFASSSEERILGVETHTGKPTYLAATKDIIIDVALSYPIISYGMVVGDNGNFRLVTIGCTQRTHYVVMRGSVSFTFYIARSSLTVEEAVFELLTNNLIKGPRLYEKTAVILTDFFERLMTAVYTDLTILKTTIRTADKLDLPCKIYFDPEAPKDTMISVDGYVYGYDLNVYPKAQINKTLQVLEKQELRDRRKNPRAPEHMSAIEKRKLAQRLEKAFS